MCTSDYRLIKGEGDMGRDWGCTLQAIIGCRKITDLFKRKLSKNTGDNDPNVCIAPDGSAFVMILGHSNIIEVSQLGVFYP